MVKNISRLWHDTGIKTFPLTNKNSMKTFLHNPVPVATAHPVAGKIYKDHNAMANKHILVAEDEAHFCHTLTVILKRAGYTVSKAGDGSEALRIIVDSKDGNRPVDLLLTDQQMPGFTGRELVAELNRLNIYLPVILIDGHGNGGSDAGWEPGECPEVMEKPFDAECLVERVALLIKNCVDE